MIAAGLAALFAIGSPLYSPASDDLVGSFEFALRLVCPASVSAAALPAPPAPLPALLAAAPKPTAPPTPLPAAPVPKTSASPRLTPLLLAPAMESPLMASSKPSLHVPALLALTATLPEDKICSLNVSDTEVAQVLRILSVQTGLNLILLPGATSKVTMRVDKMSFLDIIRHICALTETNYLKIGATFVIGPGAALKTAYPKEWLAANPEPVEKTASQEPELTTKTYSANYVNASQIVDALKKLFPDGLTAISGPSPNSPSIASVDPSSVVGQTAVSVTKDASSPGGNGDSSGPTSRLILLRGAPDLVQAALDAAASMDVPRQQVSIQVTIHDISDDAVKDLGLSWNFTDLTLTETPSANSGFNFGKVTRAPMTFDAAISALETKDVARLLASPTVSVLDGERAFILIGDRVSYPQLVGYSQTNAPIFSVAQERVGIYLQVAANVTNDGYITLSIYPQVSTISGYLNVNGASYPQVSTREAQTVLRVKSGETIILGGLLQDNDIGHVDKVPILSDLPFFGELFKHRKKTKDKSQVIITIKPIIAPPSVPIAK